jgi:hypothetical protein
MRGDGLVAAKTALVRKMVERRGVKRILAIGDGIGGGGVGLGLSDRHKYYKIVLMNDE